MASFVLFLQWALIVASGCVSANIVEHTFQVENMIVERLCEKQEVVAVNRRYPGPTIYVHEGDTLLIHVYNKSPYNLTIHWHGVHMRYNGWNDGAGYITQCPILPGDSYTYKFNITKQEGTLWWHAHLSWLRATVHGMLIIYPKTGRSYPFQKPYKEYPILLGEWWNANIMDVAYQYSHVTQSVFIPDALTINGQPGDFHKCSSNNTYKLRVKQGKTYLLRIVNAGLNNIVFFKIANHKMIVVAVDASYTDPYVTDVIVIASGQTTDVLLKADQPPMSYYMQAHDYISFGNKMMKFENTNDTASGIIIYEGATALPSSVVPILPILPDFYDTSVAYKFFTNLTGLTTAPFWTPVPQALDEHMFIAIGMGIVPCHTHRNTSCPLGGLPYGNMNNVSFQLPTDMSILEAFFYNIDGIYSEDFPKEPPIKFDYTNPNNNLNYDLIWIEEEATKVKKLRYNTTIQIVLQNTAVLTTESHPIHLHGFDFYVLAQGFGNYNPARDARNFNLVNPQKRNTVAVPQGGWVVIRFQANNPGVWLMHCHLEWHVSVGVATAFVIENGPTLSTSLPPPPFDLPKCNNFKINLASDQPETLPLEKSLGWTSLV